MINRRHVLTAGTACLLTPLGAQAEALSRTTRIAAPHVEVETLSGKVMGGSTRGAVAFKGIPYAGSVSGANRFKAPSPVKPWTGVFDATRLGPPSLQTPKSTYGENEPAYSEDCLVLNVWTPVDFRNNRKRPVMVYLHGGGYSTGSAGSTTQDGGRLAAVYDVVVVAPNHRLGLLGFLYLGGMPGADFATANPSMLDIVAALQWVKDNIAAFGGDADNVTVFGESGGGAKVGTLLGMPAAKGLFHKAGIQSGAQLKRMPEAVAHETAKRVFRALDIRDARQLFDMPSERLLALQWAGESGSGPLMQPMGDYPSVPRSQRMDISFSESAQVGHFGPVVDGAVLPGDPFDPVASALCADIPLLIGSNKMEASFFNVGRPETFDMDEAALKERLATEFGSRGTEILDVYRSIRPGAKPSDLYLAIATARTMGQETITLAGLKSRQAAPVYTYRWDYNSNWPIPHTSHTLGAGHATDIGPTFYNWDEQGLHGDGPGVEAASRHLSAIWTRFARDGAPSGMDVPEWPRYDTSTRATMLVDETCRLVTDPDGAARRMWEG